MKNTTSNTPPDLARQHAELIAFATTENNGLVANLVGRSRWTELSVYFLHEPDNGGKPWVSIVSGMSRIEGENNRHTRLASGSFERALKLIDQNGDIGVAVAETAREWVEDNRVTVENARGKPLGFDTDAAALDWLYGAPDEGYTGYAKMVARDLGAGESAVRMQLRDDRPVMVPLRNILRFLDRKAFRQARETARG